MCSVFIRQISAGSIGTNRENTIKTVEHKLILFATVRLFYYCNFTDQANSHFPKVEIQTKPKLWLFGDCVAKAKLFLCKKRCRLGYRAGALM